MKKIKILHIFHTLDIGGAQTSRINLIKFLQKIRPEIQHSVISFSSGPLEQELLSSGLNLKVFSLMRTMWWPLEIFSLIKEVRLINPDLIHGLTWWPNFISRTILKLIFRVPVVCDIHGTAYFGLVRTLLDYLSGFLSDCWVFPAFHLKESFSKLLVFSQAKSLVIKNCLDLENYNFCLKSRVELRQKLGVDQNNILWAAVGRFCQVKRIDLTVKIFDQVSKKDDRLKLILLGSGPEKENLKKLVKVFNLSGKVIFYKANYSEMPSFYAAIDKVIINSASEGDPMIIREAKHSGLTCDFT